MTKTKAKKHPIIRSWNIFQYTVGCIAGAIVLLAVILHFAFHWEYMIVATGSMVGDQKDSLKVGTLAIARPIKFEDIQVGDIITKNVSGGNLTHRVVRIEKDENGNNLKAYTRGDAKSVGQDIYRIDRASEDEVPITANTKITGKVVMHSDIIGNVVSTKSGKIVALGIIVGIIGIFIIISYILEKIFDKDEVSNEA